jgi:hypothetical protein
VVKGVVGIERVEVVRGGCAGWEGFTRGRFGRDGWSGVEV